MLERIPCHMSLEYHTNEIGGDPIKVNIFKGECQKYSDCIWAVAISPTIQRWYLNEGERIRRGHFGKLKEEERASEMLAAHNSRKPRGTKWWGSDTGSGDWVPRIGDRSLSLHENRLSLLPARLSISRSLSNLKAEGKQIERKRASIRF